MRGCLRVVGAGTRSAVDVSSNWAMMTQRIARAQAKSGKSFERILADVGCNPEVLQGYPPALTPPPILSTPPPAGDNSLLSAVPLHTRAQS